MSKKQQIKEKEEQISDLEIFHLALTIEMCVFVIGIIVIILGKLWGVF